MVNVSPEVIIAKLRNVDVQERLTAINEAREIHRTLFRPDMTVVDYAHSSLIVETLYNIICEELGVSHARIGKVAGAMIEKAVRTTAPKKPKGAKRKTTMPIGLSPEMVAEFEAHKKRMEGETE